MKIHFETLPEALVLRARSLGASGEQWLAGLTDRLGRLALAWQFSPDKILAGGSESLVVSGLLADGSEAVLKIGLPGSCDCATEARVLDMTRPEAYAQLLRHSAPENALLLERLGACLADAGLSVNAEIDILCQTQQRAWQRLPDKHGLMTGREKALALADLIAQLNQQLQQPCSPDALKQALAFAQERANCFSPDRSVLVHGDAHAHNSLRAADGSYKLVDPDGLFAEPALDLAIPMREYNPELLAGDAVSLGLTRCRRLAERTGIEARAIWQWGYIERVSTGLHLLQLGLEQWGQETLLIAERWTGCAPEWQD